MFDSISEIGRNGVQLIIGLLVISAAVFAAVKGVMAQQQRSRQQSRRSEGGAHVAATPIDEAVASLMAAAVRLSRTRVRQFLTYERELSRLHDLMGCGRVSADFMDEAESFSIFLSTFTMPAEVQPLADRYERAYQRLRSMAP